jgi:ATP-dependent Clp protease ATP-binding subunit ClpX
LVEGPDSVYICGECIDLCDSIIEQEKHRSRWIERTTPLSPTRESIRARLDGLFPGQNEAKEGLTLAALATLQPQRPLLLIGPSRSARVFAARALGRALAVSSARVNAKEVVSSERPPGGSLLQQILKAVGYSAGEAGQSVVYVDEIEDPGTQEFFLQRWDGMASDPLCKDLNLDLSRLVFLCGGAFPRLCDVLAGTRPGAEQAITGGAMEECGVARALVARHLAVARVEPLDEGTLERIAWRVDFKRLATEAG